MNRVGKTKLYGSAIGLALVVGAFVAGCGQTGTTNGSGSTNASNGQSNTVAVSGNADEGVKIFQQNCAMCHSTGTNTVVGPGLKGIMTKSKLPNGKAVSDENVANWIRTGGGGMPGFPQLTDQQRADIVAYLKTLS